MTTMIAIASHVDSFSDRWIEYCKEHEMAYLLVDLFDTNLLNILRSNHVRAVLCAIPAFDLPTQLVAKSIIRSIETMGISIFPNQSSFWHCDDKNAQKYLFESLNIPMCPTNVFFERKAALAWAEITTYPKVFKLRCGAGSTNVQIVTCVQDARKLINAMFKRGIKSVPHLTSDLRTKIFKHQTKRDWRAVMQRLPATLSSNIHDRMTLARERGYVYFQDFMPNNKYDTRVTVIGTRAFAFRRYTRPDDFRASGSGRIDNTPEEIDHRCIEIAHAVAKLIGSQSMAFDFVYAPAHNPVILEVCYSYIAQAVYDCPGYWDEFLRFHHGNVWPQDAIIEDLLQSINSQSPLTFIRKKHD